MDKSLIHSYMVTDEADRMGQLAQTFADGIVSGSLKLVELVQFLGDYLTEENSDVRSKGMIHISRLREHR